MGDVCWCKEIVFNSISIFGLLEKNQTWRQIYCKIFIFGLVYLKTIVNSKQFSEDSIISEDK